MRDKAATKFWGTLAAFCCIFAISANAAVLIQHNGSVIATDDTDPKPVVQPPEPKGDLLQFADGSVIHGELKEIDAEHGLRWQHPDAKSTMDLRPAHLDFIRFTHSKSMMLTPQCRFRFVNGDELFGSLTSLNASQLGISGWFGAMNIPRAAIQSITFLSRNYSLLYDGPSDTNDWSISDNSNWRYRDGSFVCSGPGNIGRDFQLSKSCSVEFDLAWNGPLDLVLFLYSNAADRPEFSTNCYMLDFTPEQIGLQRLRQQRGTSPFRNLGNAVMPNPTAKSTRHIVINCNRTENSVLVLVDGMVAKEWKDDVNFGQGGGGLVFEQRMSGTAAQVSNIRISQWDGGLTPPDEAGTPTNGDVVSFVNHDKAAGKIETVQGGKLGLALSQRTLDIPVDRIAQIDFDHASAVTNTSGPWTVRAHFPGGGSLSFTLEKWGEKEISGRSDFFGPLAFQAGAIRELEFNPGRPREKTAKATDDFEGLDE